MLTKPFPKLAHCSPNAGLQIELKTKAEIVVKSRNFGTFLIILLVAHRFKLIKDFASFPVAAIKLPARNLGPRIVHLVCLLFCMPWPGLLVELPGAFVESIRMGSTNCRAITLQYYKVYKKSTQNLPAMKSLIGIVVGVLIPIRISIPIPAPFRLCCRRFLCCATQ